MGCHGLPLPPAGGVVLRGVSVLNRKVGPRIPGQFEPPPSGSLHKPWRQTPCNHNPLPAESVVRFASLQARQTKWELRSQGAPKIRYSTTLAALTQANQEPKQAPPGGLNRPNRREEGKHKGD